MDSLDRNVSDFFESPCWRVNRKAADMKKSHLHPGVEATHAALDLGNVQMLCCSLLLRPRVQSVPQTFNYKQSSLVPECGLAVIVQISVSAHILAFGLCHLSCKVLLCGCCSVTCARTRASWLAAEPHI